MSSSSSNGSPGNAVSNNLFDGRLVERSGIWDARELVTIGHCFSCRGTDCFDVARRSDGLVIKECRDCGLAFVDPRPSQSQLERYYSDGYFQGKKDFFRGKDYCLERDKSIRDGAVTGYEQIVSNFELEGKSVLDVGCASGALLYLLREKRTRNVVGLDSAEYPVAFGQKTYGLDLRCASVENAGLPQHSFDLITLIDVIEHVEDIDALLTSLQQALKPGGSIFIITPNYSAHAFARHNWMCLHQDFEHLQYFSKQSLHALCRRLDWSLDKHWTDSIPFRTYDYPQLYKSGVHRLLHPTVAVRNRLAELKYRKTLATQSVGSNLNAILTSATHAGS